jgi:hypothetical protein
MYLKNLVGAGASFECEHDKIVRFSCMDLLLDESTRLPNSFGCKASDGTARQDD